ncbi:ABC transporter ATP-binding protein [Labrys sp. La1]|uniref:ABC transporter ATP-binding protein n=1 Tax=Labrys sp. La1 TaxID=3404917 RepID=UPI003EB716D0
MSEVLAIARGLGHDFAGNASQVKVLDDIDFDISSGARIGLVGPSGSGKTTLLHILGGIDKPTRGSIEWPGLNHATRLRPQGIGVVFQSPSLFPALTAVENVELPTLLVGETPDRDKSLALLRAFGLQGLAEKLPEDLSGGQAQRVAIARALLLRPRLVLADEPTGQLDSATADSVMDAILNHLEGSGCALLLATHDENVAGRLATRWTINHGRLAIG